MACMVLGRAPLAFALFLLVGCGADDANERRSAAFEAFGPYSPSIRPIRTSDYVAGMKGKTRNTFNRSPQAKRGPENIDVSEPRPCVFQFDVYEYGDLTIKTFDANKLYLQTVRFGSTGSAVDTAFALRPVDRWMEIPGVPGAVVEKGRSESRILISAPVKANEQERMADRDAILAAIQPLRKFCRGL